MGNDADGGDKTEYEPSEWQKRLYERLNDKRDYMA